MFYLSTSTGPILGAEDSDLQDHSPLNLFFIFSTLYFPIQKVTFVNECRRVGSRLFNSLFSFFIGFVGTQEGRQNESKKTRT